MSNVTRRSLKEIHGNKIKELEVLCSISLLFFYCESPWSLKNSWKCCLTTLVDGGFVSLTFQGCVFRWIWLHGLTFYFLIFCFENLPLGFAQYTCYIDKIASIWCHYSVIRTLSCGSQFLNFVLIKKKFTYVSFVPNFCVLCVRLDKRNRKSKIMTFTQIFCEISKNKPEKPILSFCFSDIFQNTCIKVINFYNSSRRDECIIHKNLAQNLQVRIFFE